MAVSVGIIGNVVENQLNESTPDIFKQKQKGWWGVCWRVGCLKMTCT